MTWTKTTELASKIFNDYFKKQIVGLVLKTLGIGGGLYGMIVSFLVNKVFTFIKKEAESEARLLDQEKKDKENLAEYKKDIIEKAPESKLIEDETNILNGGKK
jgi:hypothetical protein